MNKLKNLKQKTNTEGTNLLNKFSQRCSDVSSRLKKKSPGRWSGNTVVAGCNDVSAPTTPLSGSYNMTGIESDDHRPEIGAPVLISRSTIDADTIDAGPAAKTSLYLTPPIPKTPPGRRSLSDSSDADNYKDAISTPQQEELSQKLNEIRFSFFPHGVEESTLNEDEDTNIANEIVIAEPQAVNVNTESPQENYQNTTELNIPRLKKCQSRSANNLHKAELKLVLTRAPSLGSQCQLAAVENIYDFPSLGPPRSASILQGSETTSGTITPTVVICRSLSSISGKKILKKKCSSRESVQSLPSNEGHSSDQMTEDEDINDFDMKSASFQSLDAKNLFLSIEELNEITRQINESEEFGSRTAEDLDYEYCEHRSQLRPNERRITLLRNKNSGRLLNFGDKREKITHAWSGLKTWIGEEKGKLRGVVQRHAAMQRVGATNTQANQLAQQSSAANSQHGSTATLFRNQEFFDQIRDSEERQKRKQNRQSSVYSEVEPNISAISASQMQLNDRTRRAGSSEDRESALSSALRKKPSNMLEGQNGFEELRRYIKQGGDFGKDLCIILQERVDAEQLYSKSLSKMASKLNKACREIPGSIADAWRGVAAEMESRSDVHRQFSNSLVEDIVKPLKTILDNQHKARKTVETTVDKSCRILNEWRIAESKAKKASHTAARENEKLQDAMLDVRISRSPSVALLHVAGHHRSNTQDKDTKTVEKDCAKLDNKRRKAEEAVKRADVEYYTLCIRSERARVDWEMSVLRGSSILQSLENQRLTHLCNSVTSYLKLSKDMNPQLEGIVDRLTPQVVACAVPKDMSVVKNIRRAAEGPSEQLLPDFYCEHTTLAMNRERRKHALVKLLQLVRQDLDRERKSRNGLRGLSQTLNAAGDSQNITDKLYHIRSMLTYLEGARYKLQSALLELDHKQRTSHPLAPHIQITRDRTGLQQSILKVPLWLKNNEGEGTNGENDSDGIISNNNNNNNNTSFDDFDEALIAAAAADSVPSTPDSCVDIRNESLIKHFTRSLSRDYNNSGANGTVILKNGKAATLNSINSPTILSNCKNVDDLPPWDRGIADGNSNQPDSDFDEFSSQDEDDEVFQEQVKKETVISTTTTQLGAAITTSIDANGGGSIKIVQSNNAVIRPNEKNDVHIITTPTTTVLADHDSGKDQTQVIGRYKALYSYTPKLYDELELNPGDIIEVHAKQDDGWWIGAIKNHVGIFPATYVEELI